ncbi:MAG TPA: hypothetical protein VD837_07795 [Terriglobales bacterium]|nr:hypothetical protein [Terriglobales bacterium]
MDERKLNQLADDVHLITAPVRLVVDWIKILLFLAAIPILIVASIVNWLFTGKSLLHPEEIWFIKVLLTVLSPWITMLAYIFRSEWRSFHGHEDQCRVPSFLIFFGTIGIVLLLVKCNFYYGWGFYD